MRNHQQEPEVPQISEMDSGEKRLNELGYKQELRREMVTIPLFGYLTTICICFFAPYKVHFIIA